MKYTKGAMCHDYSYLPYFRLSAVCNNRLLYPWKRHILYHQEEKIDWKWIQGFVIMVGYNSPVTAVVMDESNGCFVSATLPSFLATRKLN